MYNVRSNVYNLDFTTCTYIPLTYKIPITKTNCSLAQRSLYFATTFFKFSSFGQGYRYRLYCQGPNTIAIVEMTRSRHVRFISTMASTKRGSSPPVRQMLIKLKKHVICTFTSYKNILCQKSLFICTRYIKRNKSNFEMLIRFGHKVFLYNLLSLIVLHIKQTICLFCTEQKRYLVRVIWTQCISFNQDTQTFALSASKNVLIVLFLPRFPNTG